MRRFYRCARSALFAFIISLYATSGFAEAQKVTILYSQVAANATFVSTDKPGWYRLTLNGMSKNTTWFTDRPVRHSGVLSHPEFVTGWNADVPDSFAKDNPEVSLIAFFDEHDTKKQQNFVLRLANPVYHADVRSMEYDAQLISDNAKDLLKQGKVYDVALFIDGFNFSGPDLH